MNTRAEITTPAFRFFGGGATRRWGGLIMAKLLSARGGPMVPSGRSIGPRVDSGRRLEASNCRGVYRIGPSHIGLRLARCESGKGLLALMGR
jgi:hypothetical protein